MAKKEKNRTPFHGLWVVVRSQQQDYKDKWLTQKRYVFGEYTFDFSSGDGYIGNVMESIVGGDDSLSDYLFSPKNGRLLITHIKNGESDTYCVSMKNGSLILYYVTEIDDRRYAIPPECWFRLILKRNTLNNRLIAKFEHLLKAIL